MEIPNQLTQSMQEKKPNKRKKYALITVASAIITLILIPIIVNRINYYQERTKNLPIKYPNERTCKYFGCEGYCESVPSTLNINGQIFPNTAGPCGICDDSFSQSKCVCGYCP